MIRLLAATGLVLAPVPAFANAYPTEATADYVIGCMAANGQTRDALRRCACSIDAIEIGRASCRERVLPTV